MDERLANIEDLCVCCGSYVPEGRMICPICEAIGPAVNSALARLGRSGTGPGRRRKRRRRKPKILKFGIGTLAVCCAVSLCMAGTGSALSVGKIEVAEFVSPLVLVQESEQTDEVLEEDTEDTGGEHEASSDKTENDTSEEMVEDTGPTDETYEVSEPDIEPLEGTCGLTDEETYLIAAIVYLEARGECAEGQQAVAEVIFNRLLSDRFPDTIREVIYQDGQFESLPLLSTAKPGEAQYTAVRNALEGDRILPTDVVYFSRKPSAINSRVWGIIGNHIFCHI